MTIRELAEAGRAMRRSQKAYFRSRDRDDLAIARDFEAQFDAIIHAILDPPPIQQGDLFATKPPHTIH